MSNLIDSPKLTIEKLLNDPVPLEVPPWQRFYSWTANEVEEFWSDLFHFSTRFKVGEPDYFVGSVLIVSLSATPQRLLLDGQQRLATSVILLAALRDVLEALVPGLARQIDEQCIRTTNYTTGTTQRRLRLTEQDDAFFERHIICNEDLQSSESKLKPSQRLIWRAKQYFIKQLSDELASRSPDDYESFLKFLQQHVRENVVAIAVTMDNEDNAISVFETLNDRGIGLSTSELVRAYLLQSVEATSRQSIIMNWQTIFDLEGQPRHKNLLRHLWISDHGDVKARALSKTIKSNLDQAIVGSNASVEAVKFSQSLADKATRYAELVAATTTAADLNEVLLEVASLGAQSLYPALLSAFEFWPAVTTAEKSLLPRYASALASVHFRHVIIGDREGTRLEKLIYAQALQISNGLLACEAAIVQLKDFVADDVEFKRDFTRKIIPRTMAQYILRKIETKLRGPNSSLIVNIPKSVHVEHIYAQNPASNSRWTDHDEYVNRIGNLTLLAGSINRTLSNSAYGSKIDVYKASDLLITKNVGDTYPVWTKESIETRQEALATLAVQIWAV